MPRVFYLIGIAIIILVAVFIIAFGLGNENTTTRKTVNLEDYAYSDATVSATTDGIINGNDQHRAIKITVSKSHRTLHIYQGYEGTIAQSYSFTNNPTAFKQFLASLQKSKWTSVKRTSSTSVDGQCPTGFRYIFANSGIDDIPNNLWSTTCSNIRGTFGGDTDLMLRLFQAQITDYNTLISDVRLR
jgi:hypothetical protein